MYTTQVHYPNFPSRGAVSSYDGQFEPSIVLGLLLIAGMTILVGRVLGEE